MMMTMTIVSMVLTMMLATMLVAMLRKRVAV
jgi:hypothetical protein